MRPRQETTLEALEIAARSAREDGRLRHARALEETLDWISATLDPRAALRAEVDVEAVLTSIGQVARPGPKVELLPGVMDEIIEALRGPFCLQIVYHRPDSIGASPMLLLVTSIARTSSVSSSIPMCILRQMRRLEPPCFRTFHSPSPSALMPVLSTARQGITQ
jgi:hypothetical protein